ncbi:LysR family transcriptional regulator [Gordonia sp. HNM0687]|uniref:LysR family transcriptional regulator n=1 Tax=Gordonia mangrovi TaxID=2665643 RepID=A0A6L7GWW2_9ACTN|nr:LysR family transcriptional regulator [Gordonia mangrovi]MXP24410.1 LysR family transcriptional regulator [Gordonia mangrovi]UVF76864.1 LysR family transcriptional regulator [Gordonia mangrovi]
MDLHLVTYFVAVVDHGGITKAAQSLYISQPSLSQAIRTLERRLGVTLFDRSGRRLELTEAGRKLDVAARRILTDVDRAKAKVDAVRELRSGRVDVVTHSAFSIDPMVEIVRVFRDRFPRLAARIVAADGPSGVLAALRRGDAEIGVMDTSAEHATFTAVPLGTQELVLAVPPGLTAGLPEPVPRADIRQIPLVVDLGDPGTSAVLSDVIADNGRNVVVDCAHPTATWDLVARGTGATIVPDVVAQQQMPDTLRYRIDPPLTRGFGLVLRSGRPSPAAMAFLSVARDLADAAAGEPADELTDFGDW